jgi:hypothetical protein
MLTEFSQSKNVWGIGVIEVACSKFYVRMTVPHSSSSAGTTTPVGFRPAQLSLSILSRKVLLSAVASGTSNPQLGGEPGI